MEESEGMTQQKNAKPLVEKPVVGRILFYDVLNAYGFARADDGQEVYIPHISIVWDGKVNCDHEHGVCGRKFYRDDRVQFRIFKSELGLEARNIKRAKEDGKHYLPPMTVFQRRFYEAEHQKRFPNVFLPRELRS
jgi:cold shock CspA family protein